MWRELWLGWRTEAETETGWHREAGRSGRGRGRSRAGASFQGASHSRGEAPGAGGCCTEADWSGGEGGWSREAGGGQSALY